jgi:hypothetical protein
MGPDLSPAVRRGMELFTKVPMDKLPDEAMIYCAYMCKKYMGCGEVMLTAYCVYAQLHEGLECDDEMYFADFRHRAEWAEAQSTLRIERGAKIKVVPING